jgi:hypothetical protein
VVTVPSRRGAERVTTANYHPTIPTWFYEDGMSSETWIDERQISFFLHLWLEDRERPAWRGRVNDGDGGHSIAFEDERALLWFIRDRLLNKSIVLPRRRADS